VGIVGQHGRGRVVVGFGVVAVLLLAACGGGGSAKSSTTTSPADGGPATDVTTSTAAGSGGSKGQCFTDPGPQHARVRFVNLFTNATYPSGDIDILQGFSGVDPCGKKLATVKFGEASDYIDVTAGDSSGNWEVGAYPAGGATDQDHEIISQTETWKGGEQVTIIVMGQDPTSGNRPSSGGDQAFFEKPVSDVNPESNPEAGKGLVIIGAASVQYIADKNASWVAGIAGQTKCLTAVGDTDPNTRTNIGGTSLVPYPVTPGTLSVSLYKSDPGTCAGTPDLGPVSVDVADGGRAFVLVYGADATHLKLLALPIAS
jgi:hypothetical protein